MTKEDSVEDLVIARAQIARSVEKRRQLKVSKELHVDNSSFDLSKQRSLHIKNKRAQKEDEAEALLQRRSVRELRYAAAPDFTAQFLLLAKEARERRYAKEHVFDPMFEGKGGPKRVSG